MHSYVYCSVYCVPACVCVCVCVCVYGSIMYVHVYVCVSPETISAVLEFTLCSYCNLTIILHVWMCVFVTVYTCVNTQSTDVLL